MASTILLKRSNTAGNDAYTGSLGEVTIDTQARKLRIHDGVQLGGHVVANMTDIQAVIDQVDGLTITDIAGLDSALQTITDDIADHEDRLSSVEVSYINKDGTVAFTGQVNLGSNRITNLGEPLSSTDAATKGYVDSEISALGNVFSYEGSVDGGTEATPFDLTTLTTTDAGSYYTVGVSGWVSNGTASEYVNTNDSILFDSVGGFKVIDNTNSEIGGTTDFIAVSGNPDTGYTVDVATAFKNRVTALEGGSVKRVGSAGAVTVDNTDHQNPIIGINNATQTADGAMSSEDKTKIDGIEDGAQVNTVDSVNGYTGTVNLSKSDVALGSVNNYTTASKAQATAGSATNLYITPQGVRYFVEDGTYTVDGGTF